MKARHLALLSSLLTPSRAFQLLAVRVPARAWKGSPTSLKDSREHDADDAPGPGSGFGPDCSRRRSFIFSVPVMAAINVALPQDANAEWVQFPAKQGLSNVYHVMRAGESLLEEDNILATNPMFLTNRENGLSPLGKEQVHEACRFMEEQGINPSVVKFTLAANAMDTADIVAMDLRVGRNRLVPEYTYMDQRGAGKWDMLPLQETQEAIWAMDVAEAGTEGLGGRPPPHDDGTPNETLANQVTRLRQLISLLETSLSGDDILLIFPDATGPAVLSALIGGIPLNRVHEHPFAPGELRLDVNYRSVRANWPSSPSEEYTAAIARGQEHLKVLRNTDPDTILNVREQDYLREQLLAEKEAAKVQAKQEAAREEAKKKQRARQGQQEQVKRLGIQQREAEKEAERAERRANYVSASQGPMDAVSLLGLGLAAAMVAWRDNSKNTSISDKESDTTGKVELLSPTDSTPDHDQIPKYENEMIIQSGDSRTEPSLENRFATGAALESLTEIHQELADLESKIEKAPIEIQGFKSGAQIKAERLERAQQAMDQYMSSDDGGEAWLSVMLALAKEDDHDDMEA